MICKSCGCKSHYHNEFCTNCGEGLSYIIETSHINCSACGSNNEKENKFCTSCGNRLQINSYKVLKPQKKNFKKTSISGKKNKQKKKNRNASEQNINSTKIFWITTTIVISVVLIPSALKTLSESNPVDEVILNEIKSSNPVVEAGVYDIASKFVCSCGSCGEQSLEICKCERATEERQFIRTFLEQNQKPDDIIIAVANKYGWMKAEFASNSNIDPSKVWNSGANIISKDVIPSDPISIISNSKSGSWNKVCPVKGNPVTPEVTTVEYDGKTYGFCCSGCDAKFLNDPVKYSKQLNGDGTLFIQG